MNLQPLRPERFSHQRWTRYTNYKFAAQDAVVTVVVQELPKALMHLPICFTPKGDAFSLAAVQGMQPGKNLCVGPDGRWLAGYVPAAYRSHPFYVANTPDGTQVICFDEDSGLLTQGEGEPFFEADGQLAQGVRNAVTFLTEVTQNRPATDRICALLQQHQLIQPWPIKIKQDADEQVINGLYRVDEAAFNNLPAEAFETLRKAGALPVAYCQMLSMQNMQRIAELAKVHAAAAANLRNSAVGPVDTGTIDLSMLAD
jgi:hypothetical protein